MLNNSLNIHISNKIICVGYYLKKHFINIIVSKIIIKSNTEYDHLLFTFKIY